MSTRATSHRSSTRISYGSRRSVAQTGPPGPAGPATAWASGALSGSRVSQPETQAPAPYPVGDRDGGDVGQLQDDGQFVPAGTRGGPYDGGGGGVDEVEVALGRHGAQFGHERERAGRLGARQEQHRGACTLYESSCALGC
ncbi:hypothetical protein GA0115246_102342 [Streptomyces sp. SolWspMP-sol7th]|nr:hypothetical protein GA0115246_102342 [Streptomyces sp. SolWspMP-sol7th]